MLVSATGGNGDGTDGHRMTHNIELVSRHLALDGSAHLRGHAAVRRWWETLLGVYPHFTSDVEEIRDLGDVTVARHAFRGRSFDSGRR
jgi:hypothetical protein